MFLCPLFSGSSGNATAVETGGIRLLVDAGVEPKTAEQDACRMEHAISDDSFQKIKSGLKDK